MWTLQDSLLTLMHAVLQKIELQALESLLVLMTECPWATVLPEYWLVLWLLDSHTDQYAIILFGDVLYFVSLCVCMFDCWPCIYDASVMIALTVHFGLYWWIKQMQNAWWAVVFLLLANYFAMFGNGVHARRHAALWSSFSRTFVVIVFMCSTAKWPCD